MKRPKMKGCPDAAYRAYREKQTRAWRQGAKPPPRDFQLEYWCYLKDQKHYEKHVQRVKIRRWAEKQGLVAKGDGTHIHSDDHHETNGRLRVLTRAQHVAHHKTHGWRPRNPLHRAP